MMVRLAHDEWGRDGPFRGKPTVYLIPLTIEDASEEYVGWLNDPIVSRYRGARANKTTMADVRDYIESIPERGDFIFAIRERKTDRHIGNVAFNSVNPLYNNAELSIMIGAHDVWGRGYGKEAMALMTEYGFKTLKFHRIWSESPNPAFNAAMKSLGWTREGIKREAFLLDGEFVDFQCWSILASEYEETTP